jgi:hypothetical protein
MAYGFGSGVRAELGATDYSNYLRGALTGAQMQAQGGAAIGAGVQNALANIEQGIQSFQKRQKENSILTGQIGAMAQQAGVGELLDEKNKKLLGEFIDPEKELNNKKLSQLMASLSVASAENRKNQEYAQKAMEFQLKIDNVNAEREQAARRFELQERQLSQSADQFNRNLKQKSSQFDRTATTAEQVAEANIAKTRAQIKSLTGQQMRAPEGYRWTPDGSQLEPIPGGPVDVRNKTAEEQAKEANMLQVYKLDESIANTDSVIGEILNIIGPKDDNGQTRAGILADGGSGFGVWMKWIPRTDARALGKAIETVQANIGFDRLQRMRDMSKTGGALGQVAIRELDALQNSITALDQGADEETLRANLMKVLSSYERVRSIFSQQLEALRPTDEVRVDLKTGKRYVKGPNGEAIEIQ